MSRVYIQMWKHKDVIQCTLPKRCIQINDRIPLERQFFAFDHNSDVTAEELLKKALGIAWTPSNNRWKWSFSTDSDDDCQDMDGSTLVSSCTLNTVFAFQVPINMSKRRLRFRF